MTICVPIHNLYMTISGTIYYTDHGLIWPLSLWMEKMSDYSCKTSSDSLQTTQKETKSVISTTQFFLMLEAVKMALFFGLLWKIHIQIKMDC